MDELRIVGPFSALTGYSKATRAILRCAELAGYRVQAVESDYRIIREHFAGGRVKEIREEFEQKYPLPDCQEHEVWAARGRDIAPEAPTLIIQIPDSMGAWHEYSKGPRIGLSMLESDRLCDVWKKGLHGVDFLMAPSRYVLNTFRRDVSHVPSELFHLPVDDRLWSAEGKAIERKGLDFLFLSIFGVPTPRKGWQLLVQAFSEEFAGEKVGLYVKTSRKTEVEELASYCRRTGAVIIVEDAMMEDSTVAELYRCADCYALPSSEGYGLPFVEAALCGRPSVALDRSGSADVVTEETGYPIRSFMAPCIGQLPHAYPSDHLFATATVDEVRKALRRAYVDKASKGAAAKATAEARFTPQALAARFRELIGRGVEEHPRRAVMWSLPTPPKWAVITGDGFGDALASLGNAQKVLADTGGKSISFIHSGFSSDVSDFLRAQPCVDGVHQVEPPDPAHAQEIHNEAGGRYNRPPWSWLPFILKDTDIMPQDVALTQVHWPWATWPAHRPENVQLSEEAEEWGNRAKAEFGEYILVQPYSTNSVKIGDHWPWWKPFISWLLERCANTHRLVFCGLVPLEGLDRPNVINLIGQTPTMQHVFALADRSRGCITTCNALANWAACRGIPALIAGNGAIPHDYMFWPRFMRTETTKLMMVDTSLAEFSRAADAWLKERTK